jgi:mannose-1-phosphate guanylyltransferase / mannose-6-phosphate isomerase
VNITPVVLSGGTGTRLWPASRTCHPKQFLALMGKDSLLQQTLLRFQGEAGFSQPLVVGNEEHRFLIGAQAQACNVTLQGLLVEPIARDTAPAIAAAAAWLAERDPGALMLVMPADHAIADPCKIAEAVRRAVPAAETGWLVTFGIPPSDADTGYGYIERSDKEVVEGVWEARSFVEKPDKKTAEQYVTGGLHHWNSGFLLCRASAVLCGLKRYAPKVYRSALAAVEESVSDLDFIRLAAKAFSDAPRISIDYALLQHSQRVALLPLGDVGWSDIGTWNALHRASGHDHRGNTAVGDALLIDTDQTYAYLADGRLLATLGVRGLVIVSTHDAMLVADSERAQEVRTIVEHLRQEKPDLVALNRRMYRPWGFYETLHLGERHHVKRILVEPKGRLSLQRHYHRSEHWVVVKGTARVTRHKEVHEVSENGSIYLPLGACHRLENPGRIPLELIEVQTGSYLGEDDIERLEDVYGRTPYEPAPANLPSPVSAVNG